MKKLYTLLTLVALLGMIATPVSAELIYDGQECNTDSYGNVTCRDKWHDSTTNVISYTNETVTYSSTNTVTTQTGSSDTQIYAAGLPGFVAPLAGAMVALGGVSVALKKKLGL